MCRRGTYRSKEARNLGRATFTLFILTRFHGTTQDRYQSLLRCCPVTSPPCTGPHPLKVFTTSTLPPCRPGFQHMTLGGTNHIQSIADGFCKKCLFQSDQDIVSLELSRSARDIGQSTKIQREENKQTVIQQDQSCKIPREHLRMWTDLDSSSNSSTSWLCGPGQVT